MNEKNKSDDARKITLSNFRGKDRAAICRAIKEERERQGLTLKQVGSMVNLPYQKIYSIEKGEHDTGISRILLIADALGMIIQE